MNDVYFKASLQNTLNPEVGTFDNVNNKEGTFTLEDGEYYLTNNTSNSYRVYYPTKDIYSVGFTIEFDINYNSNSGFKWLLLFNGDDSTYWHGFSLNSSILRYVGNKLSDHDLITSTNTWLHVKCIFDYYFNQNAVHIYIDNVEVNNFIISNNYGIKYIDILGNSGGYVANAKIKNIIIYNSSKKHYLDTIGLTSLWSKIKSLFATKTELDSKANDADVVHKSGDETIAGSKTFSSKIVGNLTGNADTATKATQDSDGNQINTTYLPLAGGKMTGGDVYRTVDNSYLAFGGATKYINGATLILRGKDNQDNAGFFHLNAFNGTIGSSLVGRPDGTLTWRGSNVSLKGHTHDDRYYTETEVNNLLNGKANDSDVVHKSSDETITGSKTFKDNITIAGNLPFCNLSANNYIKGETPSSNVYQGVRFFDDLNSSSANHITGGFEITYDTTGYTIASINARTYINNSQLWRSINLRIPNDSTRSIDFYPISNSEINLGTTTNKWKTLNGINPGALSLPSNNRIDILSTLQSGGYTAPSNGYVRAIKDVKTACTSTFGIRNETTGIEDRRIAERVFIIGVMVPVKTGEKVIISDDWNSISNANITYSASFYPCSGNV